jgi:hypothetical protein
VGSDWSKRVVATFKTLTIQLLQRPYFGIFYNSFRLLLLLEMGKYSTFFLFRFISFVSQSFPLLPTCSQQVSRLFIFT